MATERESRDLHWYYLCRLQIPRDALASLDSARDARDDNS